MVGGAINWSSRQHPITTSASQTTYKPTISVPVTKTKTTWEQLVQVHKDLFPVCVCGGRMLLGGICHITDNVIWVLSQYYRGMYKGGRT